MQLRVAATTTAAAVETAAATATASGQKTQASAAKTVSSEVQNKTRNAGTPGLDGDASATGLTTAARSTTDSSFSYVFR